MADDVVNEMTNTDKPALSAEKVDVVIERLKEDLKANYDDHHDWLIDNPDEQDPGPDGIYVEHYDLSYLLARLQASEAEVEHWKGLADEHALFDAETDLAFKDLDHQIADQAETIAQRDKVIRGLREALEPFAVKVIDIGLDETDFDTFHNMTGRYAHAPTVTCGHFRRAAEALTASRTPPEKGEG